MIFQPVTDHTYVGACRYTGYIARSIRLTLKCGHEQASRKASQGVPGKARCRDCERERDRRARIMWGGTQDEFDEYQRGKA